MKVQFLISVFLVCLTLLNGQSLEEFQKEGEKLMNEGQNEQALESFKKAIALDQTTEGNAILYSYAGLCAKYTNNDNEAKEYFQTAVKRGFQEPVIFTMLGDICRNQDDIDCQVETYRKAIELFPKDQLEFGRKLASVYYSSKNYEMLEPLSVELLKLEPNDEKLLQYHGVALQRQKNIEGAKVVFEKLLEVNADNLTANTFLGNYYFQIGRSQLEKEEKKYEAIQNPDRVQWSNFQKKTKLIKDEYYSKAVIYLEKAYQEREDENLKKMLYAAFFKLGDKEKAEKYKVE
jgi:tetratricopeptide (TPR) repeat protein